MQLTVAMPIKPDGQSHAGSLAAQDTDVPGSHNTEKMAHATVINPKNTLIYSWA